MTIPESWTTLNNDKLSSHVHQSILFCFGRLKARFPALVQKLELVSRGTTVRWTNRLDVTIFSKKTALNMTKKQQQKTTNSYTNLKEFNSNHPFLTVLAEPNLLTIIMIRINSLIWAVFGHLAFDTWYHKLIKDLCSTV